MSDQGEQISKRWTIILLALIVLLAGLLRLWQVWDRPLWDDEISTLHYSDQPISRMIAIHPGRDSSPLGLYFFYHLYNRHAGYGHLSSRLPMLLAALLAVPLCFGLARLFGSRRAALLAAAALAINPLAVANSQELRMQSAVLLLALLGSWALAALIRSGSLCWAVVLALSAVGLINLHYTSAFLFAAWGVLILVFCWNLFNAKAPAAAPDEWARDLRRRYNAFLAIAAALGVAALSFAPWIKMFFIQTLRGQSWRPPIGLAELLLRLGIYLPFGAVDDHFPTLLAPLERYATGHVLAGILILAAMSLPFWLIVLKGGRQRFSGRWILLSLAIIPPACLLAITRVVNLFDVRHVLYMLPPLLVLLGIGLDHLWTRRKPLALLACAWLALLCGLSLKDFYYNPEFKGQDFRLVSRTIEQQFQSGDALLSYHPEKTFGLAYYLDQKIEINYLIDDSLINQPPELIEARLAAKLDALFSAHSQVWLFDYHGKVYDFLDRTRALLKQRAYCVRRWSWGREPKGFSLELYSTDPFEAASEYKDAIDLRPGSNSEGQVIDGLYPQSPEGRWMAQSAQFIFATPPGPAKACVRYHLAKYLGDQPVQVTLSVNGANVAQAAERPEGDFELCGAFEPWNRPVSYVSIQSDRTFVPAQVDPQLRADTSIKSLFLFSVWIEQSQ